MTTRHSQPPAAKILRGVGDKMRQARELVASVITPRRPLREVAEEHKKRNAEHAASLENKNGAAK